MTDTAYDQPMAYNNEPMAYNNEPTAYNNEPTALEYEAEEPVPLFQCDDCGNFWDGAAQCLCGGWGLEEEAEDSESGYEST